MSNSPLSENVPRLYKIPALDMFFVGWCMSRYCSSQIDQTRTESLRDALEFMGDRNYPNFDSVYKKLKIDMERIAEAVKYNKESSVDYMKRFTEVKKLLQDKEFREDLERAAEFMGEGSSIYELNEKAKLIIQQ